MKEHSLIIYTDGGSRGNPGPAAIGVAIYDEDNPPDTIAEYGEYLGEGLTNNEAEYRAVVYALEKAKELNPRKITFYLDSQLVVEQLKGNYKIKKPHLLAFYKQIQALCEAIPVLEFNHIPRSENALADSLVNKALDAQI